MVFRKRGVAVAVDTTDEAELDFAMYSITDDELKEVEKSLTKVPFSRKDQVFGHVTVRSIPKGYETAYITYPDVQNGDPVILIIGLVPEGQAVSWAKHIKDASLEQWAPGVTKLLNRRERR